MITTKSASDYIGEDVIKVKQITGKGEVNDTYVCSTSSTKYILRIDPQESALDRFRKEEWCVNQAQKVGVPGADVIKIGMKNDHPYMVLSYIDGVDGDDIEKSKQVKIWQALGDYAHKIHSIKVSGFGENMTSNGVFGGSWEEYLEYNISSLSNQDKLFELGIITQEKSNLLRNKFTKLRNTFFTFGLIHNDLSLNNTKVGSDGTIYLLDWGSAEVSVAPHMDLVEILQSSLEENSKEFGLFLEHCGMSRQEYKTMKPGIASLKLLQFTDKLRWAIDKCPELIEEKRKEFKAALG